MKKIPWILLITLFSLALLQPLAAEDAVLPAPYEPDEFPSLLYTLRRGEIIFFGSVPITFILSGLGWQLGQALASNNYPFSDEQHTYNIMLTAGVLSLGVALLDYILGLGE